MRYSKIDKLSSDAFSKQSSLIIFDVFVDGPRCTSNDQLPGRPIYEYRCVSGNRILNVSASQMCCRIIIKDPAPLFFNRIFVNNFEHQIGTVRIRL